MSGPFSSNSAIGQPTWSTETASDGNFTDATILQPSYQEVGYGEEGYGEGGYDAPTVTSIAASTPNWTVEFDK